MRKAEIEAADHILVDTFQLMESTDRIYVKGNKNSAFWGRMD